MIAQGVAFLRDAANQSWIAHGVFSGQEKGSFHTTGFENFQHLRRVLGMRPVIEREIDVR